MPFLTAYATFEQYMGICHGNCHKWMVYIGLSFLIDNITCAEKIHENFAWVLLRNFIPSPDFAFAAHPYLPIFIKILGSSQG